MAENQTLLELENSKVSKCVRTEEIPSISICWRNHYRNRKGWSVSCVWLCDPMDCSLPHSSTHGTFQARVLEWVAISESHQTSPLQKFSFVSSRKTQNNDKKSINYECWIDQIYHKNKRKHKHNIKKKKKKESDLNN